MFPFSSMVPAAETGLVGKNGTGDALPSTLSSPPPKVAVKGPGFPTVAAPAVEAPTSSAANADITAGPNRAICADLPR
jgi:hypothetical protein